MTLKSKLCGFSDPDTLHYTINASTTVADILPPPPNTNPILFAIGSIVASLIALLAFLRMKDAKEGKHNG